MSAQCTAPQGGWAPTPASQGPRLSWAELGGAPGLCFPVSAVIKAPPIPEVCLQVC